MVTGQDYERAFQEVDLAGEGESRSKSGTKRHSARERKPVAIDDLGYVDREQGKKGGRGVTTEGYKKCERILGQLKKHPCAVQFLVPAPVLPEHQDRVKEPMDLSTVERKLRTGAYPSSYHFALDIRKIWNNSWQMNPAGSEAHNYTTEISNYFEKLMKEVGDVPLVLEESSQIQALKKKVSRVEGTLHKLESGSVKASTPRSAGLDRPMLPQEKAVLRQNIMKLPQDKLQGVIAIIRDSIDMDKNKEVLEFDIDALPSRKCRELDQYVKKSIPGTAKGGKKKASGKAKAKAPTKGKAVPKPQEEACLAPLS